MLGLSALCAGLAASLVNDYAREVRAQVGPLAEVAVVRKAIPRGKTLTSRNVGVYLTRRRVPERFVPPDSFRLPGDAVGLRALTPVPTGSYAGGAALAPATDRADRSATYESGGARLVEVPIAGASALRELLRPGARVDVLITSERGAGGPHTYLALQRIELVGLRAGEAGSVSAGAQDAQEADTVATLQVTLRQAVLLTAAQNFARELRLVPRASGDRRRLQSLVVRARDLQQ